MPKRLTNLRITKIALVPKGANQAAHVLLYKSATPWEDDEMETVSKADYDALVAKLTEADKTITTLTEQVKTLTPPDPNDVWKGVPEEVKKRLEDAEARAKQAEAAVAVEKAAREKVLYIAKARGFSYLPVNPDDDWEVFQALATLPEAVQKRLDALFKSAEELGRQAGVTRALGVGGLPGGDQSPMAELEALARSYVAKGLAKTESEGLTRAIEERPDLYNAHARGVQAERR